jgi:hypothetical protein
MDRGFPRKFRRLAKIELLEEQPTIPTEPEIEGGMIIGDPQNIHIGWPSSGATSVADPLRNQGR